ncbi:hypothetical protein [Rhodococcus sp. H29-C3]|uniref:hypothetical protein n=1 Tax=Rhodococcus sp. H29-C3 TaxID=3046307 RepID=UPI0024BB18B5|nr:hypothetical protein [Rhodococcus sp. H29-C3]MDJ0359305.1 hypothetical protein [Rhodococcus sp. H29-C3]
MGHDECVASNFTKNNLIVKVTLTYLSALTVLCTMLVLLYCVPQLVVSGVIEPGPLFELMVVFPTVVGVIASLIGAVTGAIALPRVLRAGQYASAAMAAGQIITWTIAFAIVLWAGYFATTGWELLMLPLALFIGQVVVAGGLVARFRQTRRAA